MTVVLVLGLTAAGCGFKPPAAPPTTSAAALRPTGRVQIPSPLRSPSCQSAQWSEIMSGHTADCSLHWVVVTSGDASDSPQQVLFFDRKSPIGTPTPDPRPYITITAMGSDTAAVQYQWRQGQEPACCPTGIATVRFKIEDGKLKALDPIPNA
jgi:hypothetical protein